MACEQDVIDKKIVLYLEQLGYSKELADSFCCLLNE